MLTRPHNRTDVDQRSKLDMEADTGVALSVISEATRLAVYSPRTSCTHPTLSLDVHRQVYRTHRNTQCQSRIRKPDTKVGTSRCSWRWSNPAWKKLAEVYMPRVDTNFAVCTARMETVKHLLKQHHDLFFSDEHQAIHSFTQDTAQSYSTLLQT